MPDCLPDVHLDVAHDVPAKFSEINLWMFYLNSSMLSALLYLEVVEAHLVQLLGGDGVVDLCAEFLGHDVGSELLMSSSLQTMRMS